MDEEGLKFLQLLLETPSPSGYESRIQDCIADHVRSFADVVERDWHGNLIAGINPEGKPRVLLAGHCDQIGLLVKHIDEQGFLWFSPIGGWDPLVLIGQRVQVWSRHGPVPGVIGRKPIHLLKAQERKKVPQLNELWIDIAARSREEAMERVEIGDPVTVQLGMWPMANDCVAGVGIDNRIGVWTVMTALQRVKKLDPQAAVFAVSTAQEEIGLRGIQTSAFRIDPAIGIAVDVTHATDCPNYNQNEYGEVAVGKGPVLVRGPNVNPEVHARLQRIAENSGIGVQPYGLAKPASNDANALQIAREGTATGLVTIPNRYMHTPAELICLNDADAAATLIAEFCASVTPQCDFTPRW